MKKLIILLILAMVLSGGWYYYKNSQTSGRQTYVNEKYGFEVKYPEDWNVSEEFMTINNGRTYIYFAPDGPDRTSVFDNTSRSYIIEEIHLDGGVNTIMYICPESDRMCPDEKYSHILLYRLTDPPASWSARNEMGVYVFKENSEDYPIAQQILSTFKFTK